MLVASISLYSQAGDCPAQLVCADNNSAQVMNGLVNELNSTNRGCLAVNEANGSYWFELCVSSSGTIEFIINPFGAGNDYDFAVYGPNAICPPNTAPIRCSFAATPVGGGPNGDRTGIGNGAVDFSEGPGGNGWVAPINAIAGECYIISVNNYAGGSSSFVLDFTGTAGYNCTPLPVELEYFKGIRSFSNVLLTWSTLSEVNNDYFSVYFSIDAINWSLLELVDGNGNSNEIINYSIIDSNVLESRYYYLSQTDYDGTIKQYNPIYVKYNPYEQSELIDIYYTNIYGQLIDYNIAVLGTYIKFFIYNNGYIRYEKVFKYN